MPSSTSSSYSSESRSRSESDLAIEQSLTNNNVNWISNKWFWVGYVLLLCVVRLGIHLFTHSLRNSTAWGWSALNATHAAVTFYALHWKRGSPIWEDQGKYIDRTVWEQVDEGVAFSDSRKFLILVPCFLCVARSPRSRSPPLRSLPPPHAPFPARAPRSFLISASSIQEDVWHFAFNVVVLAIVLVPKLPAMEGQRLFGVNAGPGEEE